MSREHAYLNILDAMAKIQWNVSMILEAKAVEAEKVRNWSLNHVHPNSFEDHESQVSKPIGVHDEIVEIIEGLTKMSNGLCSNLRSLLSSSEGGGDGSDGFGDLFGGAGFGDGDKEK
ncbi:restriction endonuclease subunit S [Paenibacillus sp. DYY-L-2]|uniref:restriction endonuclease subunit S n=1 Tax=Paenibacillus sp. DYY-L-2 TaxID=3447013 RepID=UPI003F507FD7